MKTFKQFITKEEAPVNSTGPDVNMNPNGKKSTLMFDRRFRYRRYDPNKMFKLANGK